MIDSPFASATALAAAIRAKKVSSLELTEHYIQRIERFDGDLNAVVVRDFDRARAGARAADAALASGAATGPLHGVPITVKEAYDVAGLPTTWGVPELRDNIASTDADTVKRLKDAGAVLLGKTNVPLNLGDFQSFNAIYGTTRNPWNLERTPGGSSGGSAAALAAGLTALEAGSDIGGSIRNPAHFCGVYGHKPTWGVVSDAGHSLPGVLAPADLAVVGPMARSPADLALSMDIVAGPSASEAVGWQLQLPRPQPRQLQDYRVAIWSNDAIAPVSAEVAARAEQLGAQLAERGATVSFEARPAFAVQDCLATYSSLLWGVMAADMPEPEREGMRAMAATLVDSDQSVNAMAVRHAVQDHSAWARANNQRAHLRRAWQQFFSEWDILICPQTATTAFPHDQGEYMARTITVNNEQQPYFQQLFWAGLVTVGHLPSTVFPTGPAADGLPIGLQAVGAEFQDYATIAFAGLLEAAFGGFQPPPGYSD